MSVILGGENQALSLKSSMWAPSPWSDPPTFQTYLWVLRPNNKLSLYLKDHTHLPAPIFSP